MLTQSLYKHTFFKRLQSWLQKYTIGHADRHSFGFIRHKHAVDLSDFQSLHAQNLISAQKHLTSQLTSVNKSKNHRGTRKTTLQTFRNHMASL